MQRLLFRLCKISPAQYWDFSPAETILMIEEATEDINEKNRLEFVKHADLKATILNAAVAPYLKKGEKFPYKLEHFLPKDVLPKTQKKPLTEEEKARIWSAAGNAFVNRCKNGISR